ncbi:MAG: hypothetical protein JSW58_09600, partial [Candidatus Latescibacterota bacterium]
YVEHTGTRFDLIQLATLESWAVETGGVAGLRQDDLVTIEGLAACLECLSPDGVVSACRAIQTPPRDNVKILATLVGALRSIGIDSPERHVIVVRDYLAVCTLAKKSPWTPDEIAKIRDVCRQRELTPVYFPGIGDDELNKPDRLPGPPGEKGDWLHHAARKLLSAESVAFTQGWPFDVRAPTDDRPFFGNFGKVGSIGILKKTFGDLWLTRTELSLLFVLAGMIGIAIAGAVLTVIPLLFVRDIRESPGRGGTSLYFVAIGLGYLMLEITMLSRLIHLVGDPVQAGALTISGFLFFSGLGSLVAQRIRVSDPRETGMDSPRSSGLTAVRRLLLVLVLVAFVELWTVRWTIASIAALAPMWRAVSAIAMIGPVGFLMGFPMPTALRRLEETKPGLVPWAWGVNGFASVLAPPLATAVGMTWGFRTAGSLALIFYLVAALTVYRLPRRAPNRPA